MKSLKRTVHNVVKSLVTISLVGVLLAACSSAATPEEELGAQAKVAVPHYPLGSKIHWIDQELYDELVDIIIAKGGIPSPENVDNLYDCRNKPYWWPDCG